MEIIQVNKQLRESEDRYENLVHMMSDGLIIYCEGCIVLANRSLLSMIGVDCVDEIVGLPIKSFVHSEYLEQFTPNVHYLIREANPTVFMNYKLLRRNGETFETELSAANVTYDGKPSVQLIIRDISNRIRMEESLFEKDYLYKSLMENVVAGVFVGQQYNLIYANPYLAELFGYTVDELLALSPDCFIPKEELSRIQNEVLVGMVSGVTQFVLRLSGKKKDGSIIFLEGNSSVIMLDGQPSLLGTVQDVTFKLEKEKLLKDSAKLYQKMIKFVPEPIVLSDQGIIVYANKLALKLIGLDENCELSGKSIFDFIHPTQHDMVVETVQKIMASDDPSPFQERIIICPDGRQMDVELSSIRINNYMGKDVMLSVIRDLTDRKRSEEVLIRSEKLSAIGQLAAGVAHEIRNPLTALKGFTQLLSARYPEHPHYFTIMSNEIDRITLIVNEFMTLAKPHFTQFHDVPLVPILSSVLSILETQAILLNVELKVCLDHTAPTVFGNADQLKQVFLNIIKNAIEAMPHGGEVQLSVATNDEGNVLIRIKDGGSGIPEELIKKIGEPFVTTKEKGTGLGIMISTRIIEAHKGTLKLSSVVNVGTVVEIMLPIQEAS
ncbi:two-component system sporulation sensor kinase A [Paenibacillus endophyticus]|uniref:histidine kinase n=1 Tax=Paenibacillus endophyticus TaxID=1294268 RepID=A0A7W5CAV8_9BACL|nr:PAS domain S-box protein [Paenibacillus endophyticus]MBB3154318.1 two-component system sporulation sensor kinase A [Paenibacillus endophyticus]